MAALVMLIVPQFAGLPAPRMPGMERQSADGKRDCTVPALDIAIGHEEPWKLHNGCG